MESKTYSGISGKELGDLFQPKPKRGGLKPRRKGFGFERECATHFRNQGLSARRTDGSHYPDLWVNGRPVSCKRYAKFPKWFGNLVSLLTDPDKPHDYILMREDFGPTLRISLEK